MKVELITIGEEILVGTIVDTNSAYISQKFREQGWRISRHTSVSDDRNDLEQMLKEALDRSDVVITTGGLGPTCDDITRSVATKLLKSEMQFDEKVAQDLKQRYGEDLNSLQDQATVPSKANVLINHIGTAPGSLFDEEGKILILLPGVPFEMRPMLEEQVIPYLLKKFADEKREHTGRIDLLLYNENEIADFMSGLDREFEEVSIGIYPTYGTLRLMFASEDEKALNAVKKRVEEKYRPYVFHSPSGKIAQALQKTMVEKGKTLAVAESCTGGKIATEITAFSGSSNYFLGSFVTYANALKKSVLGVEVKSAVSRETVEGMLKGIFAQSEADYAIATSGIAGPLGGSKEKPVGTVWVGIAERDRPAEITCLHLHGSREGIILGSANIALSRLYQKVRS